MFARFYQDELAFLHTMGKAYAQANPTAAGLLGERSGDPDVERLLEGFAFLAARIRERIEDSVPEVIHDLTEILLPHYLRPLPACSIVEFQPTPGALRDRLAVPPETELDSVPVEGTACRFRTTAGLDLLPVAVQDARIDQAIGATPVLRVQLQVPAFALPAVLQPGGIRFFVQGELPLASALVLWFARYLRSVVVKGLGPAGKSIQIDPRRVRLIGLAPSFPLLPWPRLAPAGYRTLQEYFAFPQKFLFLDVLDLQAASGVAEERFEIAFHFERPPELPARVDRETLRVNCVPVANLFRTTADPISFQALAEEHLVRAADLTPQQAEIYEVDSAIGIPEGQGQRHPYKPFAGFAHGAEGQDARFYRLRRSLSPIDGGLDTWLSVLRPADAGPGPGAETLSLDVTCTNRFLPGQLKLGDISVPTQTSPRVARFRNIVPVTKPVRPPLGTELHWRLVSHLAANRASLGDPEVLRSLLQLYNLQGLSDEQAGRANRLRVEGITHARELPARRIVGGSPVRGTRVELKLDEGHFAGQGDAFLFASVVDDLLAYQVGVNAFTELAVQLSPSQREFGFEPRSGGRPLV